MGAHRPQGGLITLHLRVVLIEALACEHGQAGYAVSWLKLDTWSSICVRPIHLGHRGIRSGSGGAPG
jgi:hypothetical protein